MPAVAPIEPTPVTDNEEGGYDIATVPNEEEQIADAEAPLAGGDINTQVQCCILHLLILMVAFVIGAYYTRNMKKHQARIQELKEQLADADAGEV